MKNAFAISGLRKERKLNRNVLAIALSLVLVLGSGLVSNVAQASHETYGQALVPIAISKGFDSREFSVAIADNGEIYASGSNDSGQLGTGDNASSAGPRKVVDTGVLAGKTILAVAAGEQHVLALDSDGVVYSWGENGSGQLGDGTTTDRSTPVVVDFSALPTGRKILKIAAGPAHSAAIDDTGVVYTWGVNNSGALGDGSTTRRTAPISLASAGALSGLVVEEISLGGYYDDDDGEYLSFSVAVLENGAVVSWGVNSNGQLGDSTTTGRTAPVFVDDSSVLSGKSIASVSTGGRFTVVIDSAGVAYSWGANTRGQLGDGSTTRRLSPVAVDASGALNTKVLSSVSVGDEFALAIDTSGQLYSWGLNSQGQLGDNSTTSRSSAVAVDTSTTLNGKSVTGVFAGFRSSLVLDDAGVIYGWGSDENGQLGIGLTRQIRAPIEITPAGALAGKTIQKTAFGYNHTLFLDSAGVVFAVGDNGSGKLGDGTSTAATAPIASGPSGGALEGKTFTAVTAGVHHSLALDSTGKVYSWGLNNYGQLGIGSTENADPTLVGGLISTKTIVAIAAGGYHSLALDSDGVLYSWGYNNYGSLGVGDNTDRSSPTAVDVSGALSGKTISAIHAGDHHTVVLATDGNAYAWGNNSNGELGDNTTTARNAPVAVYTAGDLSGKTITELSSGMYHTVALDSNGAVYTWGYNGNSEIGDGTGSANQVSPKSINYGAIAGKTITAVAAGWGYSLVLDDQGVAYSWGRNEAGQLGLLNPSNATTPTAVDASGVLASKTLTSLSTGFSGSASFATGSDGSLYGWGRNSYSDLSIGDTGKYLLAKASLFAGHIAAVAPVSSPAPEPSSAPAPYLGPSSLSVSKSAPANGAGIAIGDNLESIDAVFVGGLQTTFELTDEGTLSFAIPDIIPGNYAVRFFIAENSVYLTSYVDVVAGVRAVASGAAKVNAGSFKGYVALYALGYEGQRLSAKVGNDWVIVPSIPATTNDLFRFVEFTGTGYEIRVRIYIDRELLRTVDLTTR